MNSEIGEEERGKMLREKQMLEQFKDGFNAMNEMVRDNKEEGVF